MSDGPQGHPRIKRNKKYVGNQRRFTRSLLSQNKVYNFKRTFNLGTQATIPLTSTLIAENFSLNDAPGYTEFTALFDYYCIKRVKVQFIPYQTESNSTGTVNNAANVPIFYAVDTSDSTAPTTVEEICEYQDHKIARLYDGFSCYFTPKFADATSAARDGWVATSNPSLNWYGLKFAIPPTTNAMTFYLVWTFYIQCKDPK